MDTNADKEAPQEPASQLEHLTEQLLEHLETRWEYATLGFTEKMSEVVSKLAGFFAAGLFGLIVIFFLSVGLALWLGDLMGNRAGGFAVAGLLFVPFGFAAYIYIRPFVRDKIIQTVIEDDEDVQNES